MFIKHEGHEKCIVFFNNMLTRQVIEGKNLVMGFKFDIRILELKIFLPVFGSPWARQNFCNFPLQILSILFLNNNKYKFQVTDIDEHYSIAGHADKLTVFSSTSQF